MDDNISRKAALGAVSYETFECYEARKAIRALPSTDRTGHWVSNGCGGYNCSECGAYALDEVDGRFVHVAVKSDFCPACGADMRGADDESTI